MMAKVNQRIDRQGRVWNVTALCDRELLGKVLKQGGVTLDLSKHRGFYEGNPVSSDQAVQLLKNARNVNAVGRKAVAAAVKALSVDQKKAKKIQGVPHIQVYVV